MFYLRRISGNGIEMNFDLGNSYTLIDKQKNPHEFKMHEEHMGGVDEKTYAFIACHSGSIVYQLYDGQLNYIMSEGGKTFSNLTRSYGKPDNEDQKKMRETKFKGINEADILVEVQKMCEESLAPHEFKKWESVKKCLISVRSFFFEKEEELIYDSVDCNSIDEELSEISKKKIDDGLISAQTIIDNVNKK